MIITLCGSTRFEPWFHLWNEMFGFAGHICFSLSYFPAMKNGEMLDPEQEVLLDLLHYDKIRASDAICVLNKFAYVGNSTLHEIVEAKRFHKKIIALEPWAKGCGPNIGTENYQKAAKNLNVPNGFVSPFDASKSIDPYSIIGPTTDKDRIADLVRLHEERIFGFDPCL